MASGKVTINGSMALPVTDDLIWTKALTEAPSVKKLYIAVFDDADMLTEIVEARPGTNSTPSDNFEPGDANSNYLTKFHATLTKVDQGIRYVEFIAVGDNMPQIMQANLNDEATLAQTGSMKTTNGVQGYFARKTYTSILESTDMKGIQMIRNYAKVTIDASEAAAPAGKSVVFTGFKVFNVPKAGMIAPFNSNAPTTATLIREEGGHNVVYTISNPDCFAHFDLLPVDDSYNKMVNGFTVDVPGNPNPIEIPKYTGFMESSTPFENYSDRYEADGSTDASFPFLPPSGDGSEDFLYECPYRIGLENPFIILKAEWTEGGSTSNCYYKADFVYKKDGLNTFYNILRNFQYTLKIGNVAEKGASSIYEAVNGIAMNNFEASTMSQTLTNISNGNERLYISHTDRLLTTGRIDTVYLRNRVFNTSSNLWEWDTRSGSNYGINTNPSSVKKSNLVGRDSDLIESVVFDGIVGSSDYDKDWAGWTRVIINFADPYTLRKGMVWKQSLVFYNIPTDANNPVLNRTCTFTRRWPFELYIDAQDYVAANKGEPCRVDILIPAGLTEARFPMEFRIEQEKNTLYPDPSSGITLPVSSGVSQIPGNQGKHNYYYTRVIDWAEYSSAPATVAGIRSFSSYFKTLVPDSATTVWVMPGESDGYFSILDEVNNTFTNQDSFVNSASAGSISFEKTMLVVPVEGKASNVGTAISGAAVSYTSANTSIATVDDSGIVTGVAVGTTTIRATCGAAGAYTAVTTPVTYTVNVVAADKKSPELSIEWKKEQVSIYKTGATRRQVLAAAKSNADPASEGAITITYTSSNTSVASIVQDNGLYYVTPSASNSGTTTITATATIAAAGDYATETQSISFTVTVTSGYAPSGAIFHHESFLNRNPSNNTAIQSDYEIKYESKHSSTPGVADDALTFHGQSHLWHLHPNGDYGAYVIGWPDNDTADPVNGPWAWSTTESWLVSPEIDLSASQNAKLIFSHAANYHLYPEQMMKWAKVMAIESTDYNPEDTSPSNKWKDISPAKNFYPYPDYKFVAAAVDLSSYAGKKIRIAFKYTSNKDHPNTHATDPGCSWEVKNVSVREN